MGFMKKIIVHGPTKLKGEIQLSGAKNSVLKIICASILLKKGSLKLKNIPNILDVSTLLSLINYLGGRVILDGTNSNNKGKTLIIDNSKLNLNVAPYSIVSQMRASFIVLGPLLARFGEAKVSLPGGCSIGSRPVDIHLEAFRQMGVKIDIEEGYVIAKCKGPNRKLHGANIDFRFPSVGATENIILGAVLAEGITRISNAAKEPEIVDLVNCLNKMGAKISGAGTPNIEIEGVKELNSTEFEVMGDRMEALTYMITALMTNGELKISGYNFFEDLGDALDVLIKIGADIKKINTNTIVIKRKEEILKPINIITECYPGFPTDMQAQIMALLVLCNGESIIDETIYENRFMHVPEMVRMGADITIIGNKAIIEGKNDSFKNSQVISSDLRASAALVCAALCAKGDSEIRRIYHLERGYDSFVEKLNLCGANIQVVYDKNN